MGSSTEASVLAALEQAELAARERRLAASSEAERIVAAAAQRASQIRAGAGDRVDEALDELRRAAQARADHTIEDLERIASRPAHGPSGRGQESAAVERAVEVVVAHVLGEVSVEGDAVEQA